MKVKNISLEGEWFVLFDDEINFAGAKLKIRPIFHELSDMLFERYTVVTNLSISLNDKGLFCEDRAEIADYLIEDFTGIIDKESREPLELCLLDKVSILNFEHIGISGKAFIIEKAQALGIQRLREAIDFEDGINE